MNVKIIGVTGTIGSGKSTLIKLINQNYSSVPIIDMDKMTRGIFKQTCFIERVQRIFKGENVLKDGKIKERLDKKKISKFIFGSKNKLIRFKYLFYIYYKLGIETIKILFKVLK